MTSAFRDWQVKTSQFVIGTSFDTHCPYGPWIVTPNEIGDLILTGTPGGVGIGFEPARWLKAGDIVRVEIDRIGAIECRVVAESA